MSAGLWVGVAVALVVGIGGVLYATVFFKQFSKKD